MTRDRLFEPLTLGSLELSNRVAVAPMTRISASAAGVPGDVMRRYYERFADGGFAMVVTEGIFTDSAWSRGYRDQPGLVTPAQTAGWRAVVEACHAKGAVIVAQLMHAGALSQVFAEGENVAPSSVQPAGEQMPYYHGKGRYPMPRALEVDEIAEIVAGFATAAQAARQAGFDGVEIHGANGYLIDQFLCPHTNLRTDDYGGTIEGRLRLLEDIVAAVREAVGPDFTVGLRLSQGKVNDKTFKWSAEEASIILTTAGRLALDYLHVTEYEAWAGAFPGEDHSLVALAVELSGLPILANGSLHDPDRAKDMIAAHGASMVTIGRGALGDQAWPVAVKQGRKPEAFDPSTLSPLASLR